MINPPTSLLIATLHIVMIVIILFYVQGGELDPFVCKLCL